MVMVCCGPALEEMLVLQPAGSTCRAALAATLPSYRRAYLFSRNTNAVSDAAALSMQAVRVSIHVPFLSLILSRMMSSFGHLQVAQSKIRDY
jgi:hypothetical protein